MKRKLLPLVIAGLASGYAAADVTVYGKVNVSANLMDTETAAGAEDETRVDINSNASRLGVKGGYKLGKEGSTKAIFKMEYETAVDDGNSVFKQRNIYGGFTGDWGTLIAGNHDTPLKMAQGKVDRFNDLELGDIKNVMVGEDREPNQVMYTTPSMGGVSATVAYQTGEDGAEQGSNNAVSAVVQYKAGDLRLALAQNAGINHTDTTRLVAEYAGDGFKLGALYQMAEEHATGENISSVKGPASDYGSFEEQTAMLVSGEVKVAKNVKLKAQYAVAESDVAGGSASAEVTQLGLGADYKLNKQSKVYAYYVSVEGEPDAVISTDSQTDSTFGVGYEIKF